jgi:hypothetical protein
MSLMVVSTRAGTARNCNAAPARIGSVLQLVDSASALAAATAAARSQGLPTGDMRVLRDLTNLLVHLAPAPVVARVPLTLSRLRGPEWFRGEVELAQFLERAVAPVAPLAAGVDPGPHEHGGLVVTFWAYVDHDPERADGAAAGRSLRELHDALAGWTGALPSCDRLEEVGRLLALLEPSELVSAEELGALRGLCAARQPFAAGRPLHGDSHLRNILWSPQGPLWNDLENACSGPVEYDLACLSWRDQPGTAEALAAYGAHDERLRDELEPVLALFLAAWTIVVVTRVPTAEGAEEARRRIRRALCFV